MFARLTVQPAVLGERQPAGGDSVLRFEFLVRLADPASPRLAEQVRILTAGQRHQLAETLLITATEVGTDREAGLVEKVVAWQAVHRVRSDLQDRRDVTSVQRQLVHGLEDLGDTDAALQVAETALADLLANHPGEQQRPEHDDLAAAVLRLARARQSRHDDPLVDATVAAVAAGGAAVGLEARIWAIIDLLGQHGQRDLVLKLIDEIGTVLNRRHDLGTVGDRWRLLLAFHAGRAGYPAITQQILAPVLGTSGPPEDGDAARAVLYAVGGPRADTRLQIIGLEAELAVLPPDADDDRLRVHHALAVDYGVVGDYHRALHHSQQELPLRRRILGGDHPDTLDNRNNIATWTTQTGNPAKALQLYQKLLPDQLKVLGPDHLDTLRTRSGIALATGKTGNWKKELQLYEKLLPDMVRALGRDHPETLGARSNIAGATGSSGHPAKALRLFQELLPDQERVLGRYHTETLTTRNNIAAWTGFSGHPAEALRLFQELLPDQERIFGRDHPQTLMTRNNIAHWMMKCGHPAEALRLLEDLLPDQERIVGHNHPDTLITRINIADSTEGVGNPARALELFQELLPDQERILGSNHLYTLSTKSKIQRMRTRK